MPRCLERRRPPQCPPQCPLPCPLPRRQRPPRRPQRKPHKPHKPELVVLCDVSGSVAAFAHFTVLLAFALREQFAKVRVFAFVDTTDEVTDFFTRGGDCEDFAIAKYTALRALGVPEERLRVAIVHDDEKNLPHAILVVYTDNAVANGPTTLTTKLMVLRPGECAQVPTLGITECNRETLGTAPTDPAPTQSPETLMERHPVKVVAYATLDSYVPFLFTAPVRIEAFAYRQPVPESQLAARVAAQYGLVEAATASHSGQKS